MIELGLATYTTGAIVLDGLFDGAPCGVLGVEFWVSRTVGYLAHSVLVRYISRAPYLVICAPLRVHATFYPSSIPLTVVDSIQIVDLL